MSVRFAGSGDAFGSGGRFQTCIVVDGAGTRLLVDCGASSLIALRRIDVDPMSVDAVLLSHLHGDHFGGLPFLVLDAQFKRRTRPLTVAGPPGVGDRVRATMEALFPGSSDAARPFAMEFVEWRGGAETVLGPVAVTPFEVVHPSGAQPFALRLRLEGRTLGYSGDTEWTDALLDAARDTDLFICEAYFFERRIRYHLDCRTVVANRGRLGCRRLVLTHMSDDMLGRLSDLDVEAAADGTTIVV